ncbi:ABC transporter ATP-binding protein [Spongiactinospora sp. TRM90649]|uniref:ABC transporter ATP-binding protein n=1 Tax=Spongiactinospora sp. TRM90649 TaxID=3031114 RepID=UPI0023F97D23|nr:ABC transporter ATP-binding protein [Spongiactinospora sp. TRM90649]MDF5754074.1 ABC transporter ATP-binding protein [Spongiactinospora sp. TRM90649]
MVAVLIRLLRDHARPYRRSIALILVLQLAGAVASLSLPALNARLIDDGVLSGDTAAILRTGGAMLAATAVHLGCAVAAGYLAARTAVHVGHDLRAAVYGHALAFPVKEVARFGAPSLLTRTTNDVQQVQTLLYLTLTSLATTPMAFVGGIVVAVGLDLRLSALVLVALPVMLAVLGVLVYRLGPPFRAMQGRLDTVNRLLREQIMGMRVVRAFVREDAERDRFARANDDLTAAATRTSRLTSIMFPAGMLVPNLATVSAVAAGAYLIDDGSATPGTLLAFLNCLALILGAALLATFTVMMAPRAGVSAGRITEILDTPGRTTGPVSVTSPPVRGHLEIRDVSFTYPGAERPVLDGVNLIARPGETVAIVGSTGAGKTSLLNLIPRLTEPTAGAVLIDGSDVRDLAPDALVRAVGVAPQRAHLFTGTVASNLRYGRPDATDDELWDALDAAQARDFVEALPDGLTGRIGQGGTDLSGGQRQRLAIARLLVSRPLIYLFDDAFSALDLLTERALRDALARRTRNATVLIVAHRVATVRRADRIVVLDRGRVAGTGTHEELMRTSPTYREIVLSQLTEEEAA